MNAFELYREKILNENNEYDLLLVKYKDKIFIGKDKDNHPVIVILVEDNSNNAIRQKTRLLSVECNVNVTYSLDGKLCNGCAHIIKCFTTEKREAEVFIELVTLFENVINSDNTENSILELFVILSTFFADKEEPSDFELRGLYTELYTIISFADRVDLSKFWHSTEIMKYDFSLTNMDKIEIKSTIKDERRHHFKHDQLIDEGLNIFIVSYMLRFDDKGLSLFEIINTAMNIIGTDIKRRLILEKYIKNVSKERLESTRFDENFTLKNRKIFKSEDIPQFKEDTPSGVSNPEYDCVLENTKELPEEDFIKLIKNIIKHSETNNVLNSNI